MLSKSVEISSYPVTVCENDTSGRMPCPQVGCNEGSVHFEEYSPKSGKSWVEEAICRCCDGKGFLSKDERPYQAYINACGVRDLHVGYPSPYPMSNVTYNSERTQLAMNMRIQSDRSNKNTTKEGCYIATCVYGSYTSSEVLVLRAFRDRTLSQFALGRLFISMYYKISPLLAKKMCNRKLLIAVTKMQLDIFVSILRRLGF